MGHLHDYGEEYFQKQALNTGDIDATNCYVGLYLNDPEEGGDDLEDSSNIDAITTEPDDGNYERAEIPLDSENIEILTDGENAVAEFNDIELDILDTTGEVDSWFVVINFESDYAGDTAPSDNLVLSGRLNVAEPEELDNLNIIELVDIGGELN